VNRKRSLTLIASLAIFGFLGSYIYQNADDFRVLGEVAPSYILLVALLYLFFYLTNGFQLQLLIKDFGVRLTLPEHLSLSIVTSFGNTFLPLRGGAGIRALYLKKVHQLSYGHFLASLAGNYIISFNLCSILAIGGMSYLYLAAGYFNLVIVLIFLGLFCATSYTIILAPRKAPIIPIISIRNKVEKVLEGWTIIRKSKPLVARLYGITLINVILSVLMLYVEFKAMGISDLNGNPIGIWRCLFLSLVKSLALFITITPAALGVRESMMMMVSQIIAISPSYALAVSLLDRAINIMVLFLLAPGGFHYVKRRGGEVLTQAAEADSHIKTSNSK
jgi:uncharacterized protein (TIRG00374 family)